MLQQILQDMYIDPELLSELDEEQKQVLFCKMREEQVRKWKLREENVKEEDYARKKKSGVKKVSFLTDKEGEPLVDVFGENEEADVDAILRQRAKIQTEMETEAMRKAAEEELDKLVKLTQTSKSTAVSSQSSNESLNSQASKKSGQQGQSTTVPISPRTREVVVQALQEATKDMERGMLSPDVQQKENDPPKMHRPPTYKPSVSIPKSFVSSTSYYPLSTVSSNSLVSSTANSIVNTSSSDVNSMKNVSNNLSNSVNKASCNAINASTKSTVNSTSTNSFTNSSTGNSIVSSSSNSISNRITSNSNVNDTSNNSFINTNSSNPIVGNSSISSNSFVSKPVKDTLNTLTRSANVQESTVFNFNSIEDSEEKGDKPQISVGTYLPPKPPKPTSLAFGVAAQIEQFERLSSSSVEALKNATLERAKNRRQKEILAGLRGQLEGQVPMESEGEDEAWRDQERRAKEAERRIRAIARKARHEHLRTALLPSPTSPTSEDINGNINRNSKDESLSPSVFPRRPFRPPDKKAVVDWFKEVEVPKLVGIDSDKTGIEPWFHGIISRSEAERLLGRASLGSFLVRVSERIWGYAVSYKAPDRCRHYLIDASGGHYAFLGSQQTAHLSLVSLINQHKIDPITTSGGEILDRPCGQMDPHNPDYLDLFSDTPYENLANRSS